MAENTPNVETDKTEIPAQPTVEELQKQIKDLETQMAKQKKALDAACSDAANHKDKAKSWQEKYESTLTEAQKAEAKRIEEEKALREENIALKRDKILSSYTNKALSLGYDAELAAQAAEAGANGDIIGLFDTIAPLLQTVKTKTVTENLGKQSGLSTGTPPSTNTVQKDEENKYRKWMGLPPLPKE